MKTKHFIYFIATVLFMALPFSGFAQNDSIYVHSKGKIVFKEALEKIDSITFTRPDVPPVPSVGEYKALLMQVDYVTNVFEAGAELFFDSPVDTLILEKEYKEPSDVGGLKYYYPSIDKTLFYGTIIWSGTGKIKYPENWVNAEDFLKTVTEDFVSPKNGFENIFEMNNVGDLYLRAWASIQQVIKVRECLEANPDQKVKFFLYAPTVGMYDPDVAKWIFILYD